MSEMDDIETKRRHSTSSRGGEGGSTPALFSGQGEMYERCRALDWAATPLGPVARWPKELRAVVRLSLDSGLPMCVYAGPELVLVYNDGFVQALGAGKHPRALGRPAREVWREIWEQIEPEFAQVLAGGPPVRHPNQRFVIERDGRREETFWSYAFSPVRGEDRTVVAVHSVVIESTERARAEAALRESEERQAVLLKLSDTLRPLADPVEIQYEAARLLGTHLGASRVGYAMDRGDGETVEVTRNFTDGVPGIEGVYRYEDYGADLLPELRAGRTVVRPDIAADPLLGEEEKAAHAALQLGATVNVPLVKEGRLLAILFLHHRAARCWSAAEVALLEEVAERTWAAVERARAEAALRDSEGRFRLMADAVPQIVWITDAEGRVQFFNQQWTAYTGRPYEPTTAAEVAATTVHPEDAAITIERFEKARRSAGTFSVEHRIRSASGEYRWFLVRGEPYRDPSTGKVEGWFGASIDIHDRRLAEAALREAKEVAEQASRSKSEFLAVMSHELRTPLNAIAGYTDLIEMGIHGPVTEAQRKALGRIQKSQQHLLGLINEVLNYARLESGAVTYEITDVSLGELLATTEALIEPQAHARGLTLEVCHRDDPITAHADPEKLRQILLNLLSNAVKFTDPGGRIEIQCEEVEDWIELRVRDTGIGIPADRLESIFEPFVQVRADLTRTAEGTGLGLAISRDLARGMGGDLSVESTPGEGSTFTVRLRRSTR